MAVQDSDQILRFGAFELDLQAGELRRSGIRLPVQGRPLQVLAVLLRTPGQLVTTEQLREELWPANTFVDFDHGIRNAVARLRAALNDTAGKPRFIETVPRRGYRFVGTLAEAVSQPAPPASASQPEQRGNHRRAALVAFVSLVPLVGMAVWAYTQLHGNPAGSQIKSLAVLPLESLSGDAAQDYFAEGITDELITALAKINSVKVISRTSVMQYKGVHSKPLRQIARELGVDGVVEGTLARVGDRVRVTAQLIEASTDRHLWAERYERNSRDVLLVENEIARAIAEQLRGKLNRDDQQRFRADPIDPAAHEAYLQGRYLWNRRTRPAVEEAVRHFTEAIEKEPRFAQAYAGRADAYIVLGNGEWIPPQEASSKARADAEKALQLNETSGEAHTARAGIRHIFEWDWRGAESEFQRAIELSPSYAGAHHWYSQYLCDVGRFAECVTEEARAHALDPFYLMAAADVGYRLYWARRFDAAIPAIKKALEFNPDFVPAHRYLGQIYEAKGMYREAVEELQRTNEINSLGHAYAISGQRTEALQALQELDRLATHSYELNCGRALIWAGLRENDRALAWLERAFHEHSPCMVHLKVDPRYDPLRSDPRFADLVRRVGLTP